MQESRKKALLSQILICYRNTSARMRVIMCRYYLKGILKSLHSLVSHLLSKLLSLSSLSLTHLYFHLHVEAVEESSVFQTIRLYHLILSQALRFAPFWRYYIVPECMFSNFALLSLTYMRGSSMSTLMDMIYIYMFL